MFTGLVQDVGVVEQVQPGEMTDLWIRTKLGASTFTRGESIAVNGACLTVVETGGDRFRVQCAPETLRRTTLGELGATSKVNLERALQLSDRLGGHLVLGHVDAVSTVLERRPEGGSVVFSFELPAALSPFFIEKGSVTIDGVSLTVNSVEARRFSVQLIPETQERTTLIGRKVGAKVNLEADVIGKYVARLLGERKLPGGGLSLETLQRAGFGSHEE